MAKLKVPVFFFAFSNQSERAHPALPTAHVLDFCEVLLGSEFTMVEVEEANSVPEPETKEVLLRSLHHCIYAWIVLEYYNSFSLNVLALRILQTVRVIIFNEGCI